MKEIKGLLLLFNNFEASEGIVTADVLVRGGLNIITASIYKKNEVRILGSMKITTDITIYDIKDVNEYDLLIIPGGDVSDLERDYVYDLIRNFHELNKMICAICAAPYILSNARVLKNKHFTCYPGYERFIDGIFEDNRNIVWDKLLITAKSPYCAFDFALAILQEFVDEDTSKKVVNSMKGIC